MNERKNIRTLLICSIILLLLLSFLIINLLSFIDGNVIKSPWYEGGISYEKNKFIGFSSIILGWVGGLLGTISIILLISGFEWYYFLTITGQILTIVDSTITGMIITALSYLIMIVLIILSVRSRNVSLAFTSIILICVSWMIFGFLLQLLVSNCNMIGIIDVIASSLSIAGWWLITKKNRAGYALFITNDIMYIIAFLYSGVIVVACSFLVYLLINVYCLIYLSFNKR